MQTTGYGSSRDTGVMKDDSCKAVKAIENEADDVWCTHDNYTYTYKPVSSTTVIATATATFPQASRMHSDVAWRRHETVHPAKQQQQQWHWQAYAS